MKFLISVMAVFGLTIGLAGQSMAVIHNAPSEIKRQAVPGEFIVSLKQTATAAEATLSRVSHLLVAAPDSFLATKGKTLVHLKVAPETTSQTLRSALAEAPVEWIQPNYAYEGDPREVLSDDPQLEEQFHHAVMANADAWDVSVGDEDVVVAVTDDGVEIDHEDLRANIWVNEGEIPDNGIDDDGNGYIDDVNGYDIIAGDNDPTPEAGDYHGTHVAGIVAATAGNGLGVAGTAPGVRVMPVKFYGGGVWTSRIIAESYKYATDNGAKIITTSYNINSFVGDNVFEEGVQYGYDRGVLHFNSAGNGYQQNPARQYFDQLMLVCSTIADNSNNDEKSNYSNYGYGVDLCAPGGGGSAGILSTYKGNSYRRLSGTSMAAPNAAAVAALLWSYNPEWSRDQVAAQLFAGSENIDGLNPEFAGELGAGRVNSVNALTIPSEAPQIAGVVGVEDGVLADATDVLKLDIDMVFDPATMNDPAALEVQVAGADGVFSRVIRHRVERPYKVGTQHFALKLAEPLTTGTYRVVGRAAVLADPFGLALDGNGDGLEGDDFSLEFRVP